jgi:hypothetical protein
LFLPSSSWSTFRCKLAAIGAGEVQLKGEKCETRASSFNLSFHACKWTKYFNNLHLSNLSPPFDSTPTSPKSNKTDIKSAGRCKENVKNYFSMWLEDEKRHRKFLRAFMFRSKWVLQS